jgi:organic radical activating enzyme
MPRRQKIVDTVTLDIVKEILSTFKISSNSFCLAPYMHMDFDQSGEMHSCYSGKSEMGNWRKNSVFKEFNNEKYQNLRLAQRTGNTAVSTKNCETCYKYENHSVMSPRLKTLAEKYTELGHDVFVKLIQKIVETKVDEVEPSYFDHVEMRLSNFCNLRCMHCDHRSSTQWLNFFTNQSNLDEAKRIGIPIHPDANSKNIMQFFSDHQHTPAKHFDEIVHTLQNSHLITFSGGEPLLDPYYLPLMDEITKLKNCSQKLLDIHSNLNIKDITKYFEHWKKFRQVKIFVSIDCPPSTYNYFRRNGNWHVVQENIKKIQDEFDNTNEQLIILGHITFNLFGSLRHKEIADTWAKLRLKANSNLVTQGPTSARYLTDSLKEKAIDEMKTILLNKDKKYDEDFLSETEKCMTYLENTERYGEQMNWEVIEWCKLQDKNSDLKTLDFYPELEMYYNINRYDT